MRAMGKALLMATVAHTEKTPRARLYRHGEREANDVISRHLDLSYKISTNMSTDQPFKHS
jgi:hypothetical protein